MDGACDGVGLGAAGADGDAGRRGGQMNGSGAECGGVAGVSSSPDDMERAYLEDRDLSRAMALKQREHHRSIASHVREACTAITAEARYTWAA
jgi:hypothetical protein